jgi:hypothetical protein
MIMSGSSGHASVVSSYAESSNRRRALAARRSLSMALLRATVYSQAGGLDGMPLIGHDSRASRSAS